MSLTCQGQTSFNFTTSGFTLQGIADTNGAMQQRLEANKTKHIFLIVHLLFSSSVYFMQGLARVGTSTDVTTLIGLPSAGHGNSQQATTVELHVETACEQAKP